MMSDDTSTFIQPFTTEQLTMDNMIGTDADSHMICLDGEYYVLLEMLPDTTKNYETGTISYNVKVRRATEEEIENRMINEL